jgi:ankyrin repeat protein
MNTQIKVAIANGDLYKIKRYFKQYSISAAVSDDTSKPLLFFAVDYHQYQLLEFFLETEKELHKIQDAEGNTVLMRAVENRNIVAIHLILKNNKELVKIPSKSGKTPLLLACQIGSLEMMELLMDAGGQMDERDELDYTPLH